ncbi:hypothetical protein ACO1O0_005318 [Amphichorda felina]
MSKPQWPPQFQTSETSHNNSPTRQRQHRRHQQNHRQQPAGVDNDSSGNSLSPQPTAVPYIPSPLSPPSGSSNEIYGPDRHQHQDQPPLQPFHHPAPPAGPTVHFDEAQLAMFAAQNANHMAGLKDELTLAAGKVTPGVDDGPYIQYAIEALTRSRHGDVSDLLSEGDFEDEMEGVPPPPPRRTEDEEMGFPPVAMPQTTYAGHRDIRREPSSPNNRDPSVRRSLSGDPQPLSADEEFRALSPLSSHMHSPIQTPAPPPPPHQQQQQQQQQQHQQPQHEVPPSAPNSDGATRADPELWVPVTKDMRDNFYPNDITYPPLSFKPRILRPFSIIIFMVLCLLMAATLIFSAIYSDRHAGLTPYPGSIYSGYYFVFRLMPQLLAAGLLVYAQAIVATSLRILPFTSLASEDARQRYMALFQRLYPSTLLLPTLVGPWQFKAFSVAAWLALFTVPLQSTVFTCILVDGGWIWAVSQGVAWTLVALYLILTVAAGVLMVFWFGKWTGLMWDVRSIADLLPLLNRSNTTQGYRGADTAASTSALKGHLQDRWFDRLGYWRSEDTQAGGIWYSIGASGTPTEQDPHTVHELMGKRISRDASLASHDLAVPTNMPQSRYRYLPWCLRDLPLAAFAVTASALLLALLIVSFLPQTRLEAGFVPLLSAKPAQGAFSAANFLYSFVPSLLGMILYLLFQSLDQAMRIAQPWGELAQPDGGIARKTILADYAACSQPLEAAWRAARVGHWRIGVVSSIAALSLGIPVLAGGLFMALTTQPSGQVRMFPNIPVYGVLLALLFLYVGALTLLLPRRRLLRLPHEVTCLAGVISLCSADELTRDAAFRAVRSRADLEARLGVDRAADPRDESVWFFGVVPGKDERRLSVRRVRRFTEKVMTTRRGSSTRSMV